MTKREYDWLDIPEGLEFGIVETDDDLEELVEFNAKIHNEEDARFLRRMINHLPEFGRQMNFYIRDKQTRTIVSSLNAIPCTWSYDGIPLRVLEMGFVGTLEEYRRRGLVRILCRYFEKYLLDGQYDISVIKGIPFFYRQFGYDFMLPLDRAMHIQVNQIPDVKTESSPKFMDLRIREAGNDDIDDLIQLYESLQSKVLVSSMRDKDLWILQEHFRREYAREFKTLVIEGDSAIEGYFRIAYKRTKDKKKILLVDVIESSIVTFDAIRRAIQYLREDALLHEVCTIALPGSRMCNISHYASMLGGQMSKGWQYQLRIPDMTRFLRQISPVLEKRLRNTIFRALTHTLHINTYRKCYQIEFIEGRITSIEEIGFQGHADKNDFLTMEQDLVRLVMGTRTLDELQENNTDFIVRPPIRDLVQTLFPKKESLIYNYHC